VPGGARPDRRSALDELIDLDFSIDPTQSPEVLIANVATQVRNGSLTLAAALLQAVKILENVVQDLSHSPQAAGSVLNVLRALTSQAGKQLGDVVAIDERLRWKTEIIDIVMTIAVGLYRDRVLLSRKGLDVLNDIDYRDWLRRHGATETSLKSRFITGIYDLVFAYADGERSKPKLAAGVALRGALRMFFTYRGSMFWRMRSGMGDAVFAPLYKVMSADGRTEAGSGRPLTPVKFFFQHELRGVAFDVSDRKSRYVVGLTFAKPANGTPAESPLDRFGCWRAARASVATPGREAEATETLALGEHFDAVIFAMGRDDFEAIVTRQARGLTRETLPKPWQRALQKRNQTVATKAAQVWLASDLEQLGWYRGSAIVAGLDLPFQTWADMTHTIPSEQAWGKAHVRRGSSPAASPSSVAYFCGVLSERDIQQDRHQPGELRDQLSVTLQGMTALWPAAAAQRTNVKPLAEHVQANVSGSDRYSLSLPGTIGDRLSPLDMSFRNMTVAGDWTACGLDAGCVEAAVMSGMLAAHAISTKPRLENIIGYDHP
jgi:uncharacterized protein with NAD-binding domain and iron-sulfur cluster